MKHEEDEENPFVGMRLGRSVKVFDPEQGIRIKLERGDLVPDHLVDKVTNPALFVDSPSLRKEDDDEEWKRLTIPALRQLAENREIDLGKVTRKKDIISLIEEHGYSGALDG